jgi:hypothetical protein
MAAAAEQGHGIPNLTQRRALPTPRGGQELGAVSDELTPTMRGDVRWWATLAEAANTLDPTGRDARCNFGRWLGDERGEVASPTARTIHPLIRIRHEPIVYRGTFLLF